MIKMLLQITGMISGISIVIALIYLFMYPVKMLNSTQTTILFWLFMTNAIMVIYYSGKGADNGK